mmetsp:Transcript_9257/g.20585  ORF Transcript_9257/g.20585 Transcript_9257/m.20585 type:complete len:511 (-) Transcript_9257:82-1614(-)
MLSAMLSRFLFAGLTLGLAFQGVDELLDGWRMAEVCRSCKDGQWLGGNYTLELCSDAISATAQHFFFKPTSGWCGQAETACTPIVSPKTTCDGCTGEYGSCSDDVAYLFSRSEEAALEAVLREEREEANSVLFKKGLLGTSNVECSGANGFSTQEMMSMTIVRKWNLHFPDSVVQADDGKRGCFAINVTSHQPRVLTLVNQTSDDICVDGPLVSRSEPKAFYVEGTMALRASTRNLIVVSPREGVCTETEPCPVVFFLHGHSQHSSELVEVGGQAAADEAWEKLSQSGFLRYANTGGSGCSKHLRAVLVFPQLLPDEAWMDDGPQVLDEFVVPILTQHENSEAEGFWDKDRVSILGYSEGAFGALHAATQHPDVFSLIIAAAPNRPQGAGGAHWRLQDMPPDVLQKKWRLKTLIASFGQQDELLDSSDAMQTVMTELQRTGVADRVGLHFRVYMGLGHLHWDQLYNQWPGLHQAIWQAGMGFSPHKKMAHQRLRRHLRSVRRRLRGLPPS